MSDHHRSPGTPHQKSLGTPHKKSPSAKQKLFSSASTLKTPEFIPRKQKNVGPKEWRLVVGNNKKEYLIGSWSGSEDGNLN